MSLAIIGTFGTSLMMFLYGLGKSYDLILEAINGIYSKTLVLGAIEVVDLFLLATVFFIISLGLFELFIDDSLDLPDWLEIKTIEDLKVKLVGVVIVVLAVLFLGQVVTWDGQRELLGYGVAIASVIGSLTWFLKGGH